LSLRRMSQLAGISNPYLSQIERGLRKPSAEILQKIAKALRLSAEAFYIRAGILEDVPHGGGLEGAIWAAPDLTDEGRHALIAVYRSLRTGVSEESPPAGSGHEAVVASAADDAPTGGAPEGGLPSHDATRPQKARSRKGATGTSR